MASDANGNPVANVKLKVEAAAEPLHAHPFCPHLPTLILGPDNRADCPTHPPIGRECGSRIYPGTTDLAGTLIFHILVGDGSLEDRLTVSAPEHPQLAPLIYRYPIWACEWQFTEFYYPRIKEPTDGQGHFINAAIAGQASAYPLYVDVYTHPFGFYFDDNLAGEPEWTYLHEKDTERQWQRAEHPQPLWVTVEGCEHASGCAHPNPMRYVGQGRYETYIRTNPTPGPNRGTLSFPYLDRSIQREYVRRPEWIDDIVRSRSYWRTIFHGWAYTDIPFAGVTGLRLQTTVQARGVPQELAQDAIHLDEAKRSRYATEFTYTIEPADYHALDVAVHVLKHGVTEAVLPGSSRSSQGRAHLPKGFVFDPEQTYHVQLVLNAGSKVPLRAEPIPLKVVPAPGQLLRDVTQRLVVSQDLDVSNRRSCLHQASLALTLSREARLSLVFKDVRDAQRPQVLIDDRAFAPGEHRLPFSVSTLGLSPGTYGLAPGTYRFALTAISTDPKAPQEEAVLGQAVVTYRSHQTPVGRTLVRGVDVATGNLTLSTTDLEVPGRGPHLKFERHYHAQATGAPGPLGVGWRHPYQSRVVQDACGTAIVTGGIGGGSRFVRTGDDQWAPLKGYHGTLHYHKADDAFDFYSPDGTRHHYAHILGIGYLLAYIADPNGNLTQLAYDPADPRRLTRVTDPAGRRLTLSYATRSFTISGRATRTSVIIEINAPGGQQLRFDYDDHGNLIRVAREDEARVETYTYYPDHPVELDPDTHTQVKLHGKLHTYTNPNGATTTYTYRSRVQHQRVAVYQPGGGHVSADLPVTLPQIAVHTLEAPGRGTTRFAYDPTSRITTVTNGRGATTRYTLNDDGAVIAEQDALGHTTRTTWSERHLLPTSRTDANGVTTTFTYDAHGNRLSETVAGLTTTYTYLQLGAGTIKNRLASHTDRNGHLTRFDYDERGNFIRLTDALGGITQHSYSARGDRLSTRDPLGRLTKWTYNAYGLVQSQRDALGGITRTQWDERSRKVRVTDALGRTTRYAYDTLNRRIRQTDALGQVKSWTYDPMGNPIRETDEAGHSTRMAYDAANRLMRLTNALGDTRTLAYDPQGNPVQTTNFRGHPTRFDYDLADRLTQRLEPEGRSTQWTYDSVGRITSETDALGRTTQYAYDDLGRRTQQTDALGGVTTYAYDPVGNLIQETNAKQQTTRFTYDALNRLVMRLQPLGRITTYAYDAVGNRTEEIDAAGHATRFEFDPLGRLIQRTDALGHTTVYTYDLVGNRLREVNPRHHETHHTYDALNRILTTTDPAGYPTTYTYDPVGNVLTTTLPNQNVIQADYDALGRLTRQQDNLGLLMSYTYDADGNRTQETDARGHLTTNVYDGLNQMIEQALPEQRTERFGYDLMGNPTLHIDADGHATTNVYDALNRLIATEDALGHTQEQAYDLVGNPISATDPRGHTTQLAYDDLNQLINVTDPLGQSITYTYDLVGNRIQETDKRGIVTRYTYDPLRRRLSTERDAILMHQVTYDAMGNRISETDAGGHSTTYRYDPRHLLLLDSRPLAAITPYA